jgi:hypothetical protein
MPAWATVSITLGASAIGVLGTLLRRFSTYGTRDATG